MSLDDLINKLLDEKVPAKSSTTATAEPASNGEESAAPAHDAGEVTKLKGDIQRLMLQVKVLKAENDGLKAEAIKREQEPQSVAAPSAAAEPDSAMQSALTPKLSGTAFPWKRHIGSVEDSLRKKQTEVAECALKVLVDVAEVIDVEPAARARLLSQLGGIRLEQGNYVEAEETLNGALALLQSNDAMNTISAAFCLDNLAQCYLIKENYEVAEKTRRQAVTIAEDCLGGEHPDVGYFRERLDILRQERSLAQIGADDRSKTVLTVLTEEYNAAVAAGTYAEPQHKPPDSYSGLMLDKFIANGKQALSQKNAREAESYFRSALEKAQNVPDNDPRKCEVMRALGSVLETQNKDNEAREMFEAALTVAFKNLGWHDINVAHSCHSLADLHNKIGDFGKSKNYYKQALTAFKALKDEETAKILEEKYVQFIDRIKSERQWKNWSN
jgi:tetratricopeptide (TPR) repeat protein